MLIMKTENAFMVYQKFLYFYKKDVFCLKAWIGFTVFRTDCLFSELQINSFLMEFNQMPYNHILKPFFLMMKKTLFFFLAAIMFSCNNGSKKQEQSASSDIADEQVAEVKSKVEKKKNLPPQSEKYTWFFEMCDYSGTYDANQYSDQQLENTLKWLLKGEGTMKPFSIFQPGDLNRLDRDEVEREFDQILANLKSLEFVETPYFNELKESRIKEVERLQLLSLMQIESFSNPEVFRQDAYSKEQCSEYTNALIAGGDELLAMRKKMAEQSRDEGNSSAWEQYIEEAHSDNELELARIHVSTFGWWNCVNSSIERIDAYEAHENKFLELFQEVTRECEQP